MADISARLVEQVQAALADNTPLNIQGNGTKHLLGRAVPADCTPLTVNTHSGIVKYEPGELVLTARAGTTLAEIDAALTEQGQMLACDPRRYGGQATLGGSLATHQSGPARPWYGSLRDHVLGVRLINGKGEHLRFGGQVMKNVAGYDVSRLQAGAMGTLGVITEVSLKVLPQPDFSLTLIKETDLPAAHKLTQKLARSTKPLTGMSWVDNRLYLRLQGSRQAIEATAQQWQQAYGTAQLDAEQAAQFWQQLREHELDFFQQSAAGENSLHKLWRFSLNPRTGPFLTNAHESNSPRKHGSQKADFHSNAHESNSPRKHGSQKADFHSNERWLFNWAGAQRWLIGDYDLETLGEHALASGGEVCLYESGDGVEERLLMANTALQRIQQNVKTALDPQGIFNPGKLFSWL